MNININLAEFGGVILALLSVGALLKHAFPNFPNRLIPLFTWVLGVVAYLAISKGWADAGQWIAAVVAAATATGAHSGVKNTMPEKGENIAPPLSLWLLCGLLSLGLIGGVTTGCSTSQQRIAFNSLHSVQTVTVGAYDGYVAEVIAGRIRTNDLPRVSQKFNTFQAAFRVALDGVEYNTNALAPPNVTTLSGDLLNLINQLAKETK